MLYTQTIIQVTIRNLLINFINLTDIRTQRIQELHTFCNPTIQIQVTLL